MSAKMSQIKGPAIYLIQFLSEDEPFNTLENACRWMAEAGYKGVQMPTENPHYFDLKKVAESQDYADEVKGRCAEYGVEITELATHIQGQLVAVHPAYNELFDGFAPPEVRGNPTARTEWAIEQVKLAAIASRRLGLNAMASFSGALAWPYMYPWPQRPDGLVREAFSELARRWKPILDVANDNGVDICYEIHPGEDLHDGASYERFLDYVDEHPRANILYDPSHFILQQLDYLHYIDLYHERIKMFHVKDAEFRPDGRTGVYGGFNDWRERAGRFRSLGDGQIDFGAIFSKLTDYGYDGWAVVEWECCIKDPKQGAIEGSKFVSDHIIRPSAVAFDDFAGGATDKDQLRRLLGL